MRDNYTGHIALWDRSKREVAYIVADADMSELLHNLVRQGTAHPDDVMALMPVPVVKQYDPELPVWQYVRDDESEQTWLWEHVGKCEHCGKMMRIDHLATDIGDTPMPHDKVGFKTSSGTAFCLCWECAVDPLKVQQAEERHTHRQADDGSGNTDKV